MFNSFLSRQVQAIQAASIAAASRRARAKNAIQQRMPETH